jgi:hypothetical protein
VNLKSAGVTRKCKHPPNSQHAVAWEREEERARARVITRWCDQCGALWEACGWGGQRSKWRSPQRSEVKRGKNE